MAQSVLLARASLIYLKEQLNGNGDFFTEWKSLSVEDQKTLKAWAAEEMAELGL